MGRAIVGGIVGYAVIFVIVFVGLSLAWAVMGADGAFKTGTWNVTTAWVVTALLVGIVASVVAGYVCSMVGRQRAAVIVLLGIVAVMGVIDITLHLNADRGMLDAVRLGDVSMFEAMGNARNPAWFPAVNLIVGLCGIVVGSRLRK